MNDLTFNTKFIRNYRLIYNLDEESVAPQTYAIYWCMMATFTNRVFSKDEMREFLLRLAITLHTQKLMESWFAYDRLLNFTYKGIPYVLNFQDLFNHFGFEAVDTYMNSRPQNEYLNRISEGIKNAMIIGILGDDFQVLVPKKLDEETLSLDTKEFIPEIDTGLIKNAGFFAEDLMKKAPAGLFEQANPAIEEKLKELEERRERVRNLPKFSLEKIPDDVIEQCMHLMLNREYIEELKANHEKYRKECHRLIHLAWLYANGLAWGIGWHSFNMAEGVEINHKDYTDEYGSVNIHDAFDEYNMEECVPLLKGR